MSNSESIDEEKLPSMRIYRSLESLVKRLGNTNWGSVAFDIEVGKTRNELNKIVDDAKATAERTASDQTWYEVAKMIIKADKENKLEEVVKIANDVLAPSTNGGEE